MMTRELTGIFARHPETGFILCQDGQWRDAPHFGTLRTCARVYRSATWALKASERHRGSPAGPGEVLGECVHLYVGDQLLPGGEVLRGGR